MSAGVWVVALLPREPDPGACGFSESSGPFENFAKRLLRVDRARYGFAVRE